MADVLVSLLLRSTIQCMCILHLFSIASTLLMFDSVCIARVASVLRTFAACLLIYDLNLTNQN